MPPKCVGCGTCATVCPTCALESLNPSDAELKVACLRAARGDEVVIVCSQMEAALGDCCAWCAASVICAGRVDESLLAGSPPRRGLRDGALRRLRALRPAPRSRHGGARGRNGASGAGAWGNELEIVVTDIASGGRSR